MDRSEDCAVEGDAAAGRPREPGRGDRRQVREAAGGLESMETPEAVPVRRAWRR